MALQARCPKCKQVYGWDYDYPLYNAHCPRCQTLLRRTTWYCKGPRSVEPPLYPVPGGA